jgi:hypothetical protein
VLNSGALTCGANSGSPVTDDYDSPFKLTAAIHRRNGGRQRRADPLNEAELRVHMSANRPPGSHTEEHAGMVDLDADSGPDNR